MVLKGMGHYLISHYLTFKLRNVVDPVIKINYYFLQPQNLLLCMLADKQPHVKELALRWILSARLADNDIIRANVRSFSVPK